MTDRTAQAENETASELRFRRSGAGSVLAAGAGFEPAEASAEFRSHTFAGGVGARPTTPRARSGSVSGCCLAVRSSPPMGDALDTPDLLQCEP
jgi:hypothetical protein